MAHESYTTKNLKTLGCKQDLNKDGKICSKRAGWKAEPVVRPLRKPHIKDNWDAVLTSISSLFLTHVIPD